VPRRPGVGRRGYQGEWTAGILTRYDCRSEFFEPVPAFAEHCRRPYQHNSPVYVHRTALGGTNRKTSFNLTADETSAFRGEPDPENFEAHVVAIAEFLSLLDADGAIERKPGAVGVLKLNIEGGEYEVLKNLLKTGAISRFRCLLI